MIIFSRCNPQMFLLRPSNTHSFSILLNLIFTQYSPKSILPWTRVGDALDWIACALYVLCHFRAHLRQQSIEIKLNAPRKRKKSSRCYMYRLYLGLRLFTEPTSEIREKWAIHGRDWLTNQITSRIWYDCTVAKYDGEGEIGCLHGRKGAAITHTTTLFNLHCRSTSNICANHKAR